MKKIFTYFFLSIIPFISHAQFDYTLDFVTSLDHNTIDSNTPSEDSPRYNYRIGGNFSIRIFDNIMFKTGLRYAQVGYEFKREFRILGRPDSGGFYSYTIGIRRDVADQRFIEIPLISRYESGSRKLSFFFEFGLSPHIYLSSEYRVTTDIDTTIDGGDDTLIGGKRFLLALVLGGGINYTATEKVQLFIQPTFRSYASNTSNFAENVKVSSIGLEIGIRRGFKFKNSR